MDTEAHPGGLSPRRRTPRRPPRQHLPSGPVMTCRVRVRLPRGSWMERFAAAHPDLHWEVTHRMELGRGATLFELRVNDPRAGSWVEELRELPGILDVELLHASGSTEVCRVFARTRTFLPALKRTGLLHQFPFPIRDGMAVWDLVGPAPRLRALLEELGRSGHDVQVEAMRQGCPRSRPYLTEHQQKVLRRALAEGYFEVPRRISLTGLALRVGVRVSTLSVTLAIIEKKMVERPDAV